MRCCGSSRFAASTRARFRRRCRCAGFCAATRGLCSFETGDLDRPRGRLRPQRVSGACRARCASCWSGSIRSCWAATSRRDASWRQAIAQLWQNSRLPEVRRAVGPQDGIDRQHGRLAEEDDATRVFLQDVPRLLEHTGTVQLGPGEIFGELAALSRTPRTATVLADGPATLLEIRWQGLRDLMRRTPAIREHVERLYRENSLRVHLRETPLLQGLPAEALERVAAATVFESYGNFDWYTDFGAATPARSGRADCGRAAHRGGGRSADGAAADALRLCPRQPAARARASHVRVSGQGAGVRPGGAGRVARDRQRRAAGDIRCGRWGMWTCCGFRRTSCREAILPNCELRIANCGLQRAGRSSAIRNPRRSESANRSPRCSIFSPIIAFSTARRRC